MLAADRPECGKQALQEVATTVKPDTRGAVSGIQSGRDKSLRVVEVWA